MYVFAFLSGAEPWSPLLLLSHSKPIVPLSSVGGRERGGHIFNQGSGGDLCVWYLHLLSAFSQKLYRLIGCYAFLWGHLSWVPLSTHNTHLLFTGGPNPSLKDLAWRRRVKRKTVELVPRGMDRRVESTCRPLHTYLVSNDLTCWFGGSTSKLQIWTKRLHGDPLFSHLPLHLHCPVHKMPQMIIAPNDHWSFISHQYNYLNYIFNVINYGAEIHGLIKVVDGTSV